MKKNLGATSAIFPMPVLMVGTYDSEGKVDVMNAAWGMMEDMKKVALNLTATHKTVKNIKEKGAFTVAIADVNNIVAADYVGMVSGNTTPDKFEKSGLHATKSEFVDAPVIDEFPITMECKFIEYQEGENGCGVIGEIVNVVADEKVLDANGKVDPLKINAILFDTFGNGYYSIGEKVGQAFSDGKKLM
ncbi:MAG: flavin reductase [Clostridia bacterium]|nr:flavin reductase [Clostridia bacterium]